VWSEGRRHEGGPSESGENEQERESGAHGEPVRKVQANA
jgi:hypothetical protein